MEKGFGVWVTCGVKRVDGIKVCCCLCVCVGVSVYLCVRGRVYQLWKAKRLLCI